MNDGQVRAEIKKGVTVISIYGVWENPDQSTGSRWIYADASVHHQQQSAHLRSAIATLPDEQARLLRLAYFEDKSHNVIADELGLPLGTVKSRIRLAMSMAGLGRFEDAEPIMLDAYSMFEQTIPGSAGDRRARRWVARFYDLWGRPDDAARYR